MGKYSWLGPYENVKDDDINIIKNCTIKTSVDKKIIKESGKPDRLALWNFILNPRDDIIAVGDFKKPSIGYDNHEYLTIFQNLIQHLWKIFLPKFDSVIPIISLSEAKGAGLYDHTCLREQFPGPNNGNAPGYKGGAFDKRQIGGWKWFSLILDEENWKEEWEVESIGDKLDVKDQMIEKIAPKYYNSYIYIKGRWKEDNEKKAFYGTPSGCKTIPRRFSEPIVSERDTSEYKNFMDIILKTLKTQWTLNIWNIISFDYKVTEKSVYLGMNPEIIANIGWFETYPLGEKEWGDLGKNLHRHFENVYNVKVGLTEKYKLYLPLYIKNKINPFWDGSTNAIINLLSEPYTKLMDTLVLRLKELMGEIDLKSLLKSKSSPELDEEKEFEINDNNE